MSLLEDSNNFRIFKYLFKKLAHMAFDLMLVDDNEEILDATETLAKLVVLDKPDERYDLHIIKFKSGVEALQYLREHADDLPRGYLVDMRLAYSDEELASPLEIYRFLEQHNATKHFKFYTGHISEHDRGVQIETGAEILLKLRDSDKLRDFLGELARNKSRS